MAESKIERLDSLLISLKSIVVAFSGGVDSSFLLHRAASLNSVEVLGVTIRTPYIPKIEIDDAVEFTRSYGIRHKIIDLQFPEAVRENPPERCYICKKSLFSELISFAGQNGYTHVVDGTNADDGKEYRPGLKALAELSVRSPLLEAGLGKAEIRELSNLEGLSVWNKPALACLLTRIPYNIKVSEKSLRMIENAEKLLFDLGLPGSRVRIHDDLARIECPQEKFDQLIHNPVKDQVIDYFKRLGFKYISLDLEGYRTGSFKTNSRNHDQE